MHNGGLCAAGLRRGWQEHVVSVCWEMAWPRGQQLGAQRTGPVMLKGRGSLHSARYFGQRRVMQSQQKDPRKSWPCSSAVDAG